MRPDILARRRALALKALTERFGVEEQTAVKDPEVRFLLALEELEKKTRRPSLKDAIEIIRKASDEELLAVEGIGKASLKKLREAL
ncbi:hypothetical protein [Rubrobacter calidifluminis]|uniref:hypothetical protein n=1 Tax=Rubrobacter calidifluminis TaxID=1392640 RepID=UPI002360019F|nr:hypothetical protein [Rubrobacter calidifluminis]